MNSEKIIAGIDPSLNSTGIVVLKNKEIVFNDCYGYPLKKNASMGDHLLRNLRISKWVIDSLKEIKVDIIGIEGIGSSPKNNRLGNQIKLIKLLAVIESNIFLSFHKTPLIISPPSWKKDFIGDGRADKKKIKKFIEDMGVFFKKQDCYDAFGIAKCIELTRCF